MTAVSKQSGKSRVYLGILIGVFATQACAVFHKTQKEWYPIRNISHNLEINSSVMPDSAMAAEVQSYRVILNKNLGKKIGYAESDFKPDGLESGLYNLVSDALRIQTSLIEGKHIDVAVMSASSIKYYIPRGPITQEIIDEILPYVNKVVLMKLTGKQLSRLANDIATDDGAPVSGMRMLIKKGMANDLLVGQHVVEPDSVYTVVTSSYLANGGGHYNVLWQPNDRRILPMTTRDALRTFIEDRGQISPVLDGRMRK